MSTHNICFHGEIRKNINIFSAEKMTYLEICVGYVVSVQTHNGRSVIKVDFIIVLLNIFGSFRNVIYGKAGRTRKGVRILNETIFI